MRLLQLLEGVDALSRFGPAALFEKEISGIEYDSRRVQPGNVFVAMRGETTDGNRYIQTAIERGAAAIISDSPQSSPGNLPWVQVNHGRRALAALSANFYAQPAQRLKLTGITGTNGKTTTTFLLSQLLGFAGHGQVALIGTVEYHYAGLVVPAPHTTPEPLELQGIFAQASDPRLGKLTATEAVMEVSSHALAQERVYGLQYDVAVFTNLTRDHLDYHQTMKSYFEAKQRLFTGCGAPAPRVAVINSDDEAGRQLISVSRAAGSEVLTYGIDSGDFRAESIEFTRDGTSFQLHTPAETLPIRSQLIGRVNVYNLLAATVAAHARGVRLETLASAAIRCQSAPGRFQRVDCGQPFAVVVDYAHTDDALRNLTGVAHEFVSAQQLRGRVITLFGCGGDRDKAKRPLMAAAAGEGSDFVVLTSDNPRSEEPMAIIADALPGLQATGTKFEVEPDRRKAIQLAISKARSGDIVLIAGKGHEKYQITRAGKAHFDDVEVARQTLQAAGFSSTLEAAGKAK